MSLRHTKPRDPRSCAAVLKLLKEWDILIDGNLEELHYVSLSRSPFPQLPTLCLGYIPYISRHPL